MSALAYSVETLKADTSPETQTVSALVRSGLAQFVGYPDLNHMLSGIDSDTSLPVEANITISLERQYTCMTCMNPVAIELQHVVISGVYSFRKRTGRILDHHHLHTDCFVDNELPFWDEIVILPMDRLRREIILRRIRQAKTQRRASSLAA